MNLFASHFVHSFIRSFSLPNESINHIKSSSIKNKNIRESNIIFIYFFVFPSFYTINTPSASKCLSVFRTKININWSRNEYTKKKKRNINCFCWFLYRTHNFVYYSFIQIVWFICVAKYIIDSYRLLNISWHKIHSFSSKRKKCSIQSNKNCFISSKFDPEKRRKQTPIKYWWQQKLKTNVNRMWSMRTRRMNHLIDWTILIIALMSSVEWMAHIKSQDTFIFFFSSSYSLLIWWKIR